ncbi:pyridoxal kinase PdxY [Corynebacterium sanguinis]|uniref:pyridoxal kinase PdxY n=1 Tax=Corynebacterium sanguinis TaxID=2594913 RepID=UPI0021AF4DED|nr:pyridoxal kinase PdxY [Corynebacterium sanguinis]MCT1425979.1 pyridoxal kinase PdxY [Corynebacterium sanguinis]MCT1694746.1 pyridoxal kinase PdxY [Corynebacterium sanguinis]MCT1714085.1 pyridoxal kinase PdxY [Corynebacterium sanguinis]MCT1804829.1 pyridoxal kinase PdxY [Corynebacterium sanguinis]MCT2157789.1 pyridoxal kinase PdxY [Corynebacterium sanguinis]
MNILSIQSAVAYGHVGNSAAVFPLQRIGHEVWPVYTVNFSNHTGYGAWRGPMIPAADVADVIAGIDERGALGQVDAVLSGYQGGDDIAGVIIDAVARVKELNPAAVYACDPVMGNAKSGCFVADTIPPLLRDRVVPVADIITPNQFELGYLTGREATDLDSTLDAVAAAREMGPQTVLVTSVERPEADPENFLEMIVVDDKGSWIVRTPRLPFKRNGSGDVASALFTGHYIRSGDAADALARTASSVFDLLSTTYEAGAGELLLVEAQDAYAQPRLQFEVEAL